MPLSKPFTVQWFVFRLSYVVWLLEELIHHIPRDVEWNVVYDVACTLVRHLKTSDDREYLLD